MAEREKMKRSEKLQLMLDAEELLTIDEWRFDNRMPSRAAAIRELLRRGLLASDQFNAPDISDAVTGDFGVVDDGVKKAVFGEE